jgi:hypothetical protein
METVGPVRYKGSGRSSVELVREMQGGRAGEAGKTLWEVNTLKVSVRNIE